MVLLFPLSASGIEPGPEAGFFKTYRATIVQNVLTNASATLPPQFLQSGLDQEDNDRMIAALSGPIADCHVADLRHYLQMTSSLLADALNDDGYFQPGKDFFFYEHMVVVCTHDAFASIGAL